MKKLIRKYRWLLIIISIPYCLLIVLTVVPTNYEISSPGGLSKIESLIEIDQDYQSEGSFHSVYVMTRYTANLFQKIMLSYSKSTDATLKPESTSHLSRKEQNLLGEITHTYSKHTSIIYAYLRASLIDSSISISYKQTGRVIYYYSEANSTLKIGDQIIKINQIDVSVDVDSFNEAYSNITIDDTITILRNNKELEINLKEHNIKSIWSYRTYNINTLESIPSLVINNSNHHGNSAGLLQTLCNFNNLLPFDYTKGLKICGTGVIDINGNVSKIGGVKQKLYAASYENADVFFIPYDNKDEAFSVYNQMKKKTFDLVVVKTFDDALDYLLSI